MRVVKIELWGQLEGYKEKQQMIGQLQHLLKPSVGSGARNGKLEPPHNLKLIRYLRQNAILTWVLLCQSPVTCN